MLLRHGVVNGDEMFVLHILGGDGVVIIRFFRLQSRQGNATAADERISQTVNRIAADRADIELRPQHIGGDVLIDNVLTIHQLDNGDTQCLSQGLQKRNIR